jgi:hypothetical protein
MTLPMMELLEVSVTVYQTPRSAPPTGAGNGRRGGMLPPRSSASVLGDSASRLPRRAVTVRSVIRPARVPGIPAISPRRRLSSDLFERNDLSEIRDRHDEIETLALFTDFEIPAHADFVLRTARIPRLIELHSGTRCRAAQVAQGGRVVTSGSWTKRRLRRPSVPVAGTSLCPDFASWLPSRFAGTKNRRAGTLSLADASRKPTPLLQEGLHRDPRVRGNRLTRGDAAV